MDWLSRILFEDGEALVINKPAGLAVHPGPTTPDSLEQQLPELRLGFQRAPAPAHRLDRDTSGCLLLARNPKALKRFMAAFEQGQVEKTYVAILDGEPETGEGLIDLPLLKHSTRQTGWRMVVDPAKGKAARTHWRLIACRNGRSLVEFRPEPGRTHQIRVHAATGIGLPIAGDPVYGSHGGNGPTLLHAWKLTLPRPGKKPVSAAAPLPAIFIQAGFGTELVE